MNKASVTACLTSAVVLLTGCSKPADTTSVISGRAVGAADSTGAVVGDSGFVYTADEHGKSVSVIDLGNGQRKAIPIGIAPHNVQVSRDGRLLLVVGAVENKNETGAVGHSEMAAMNPGRLLVFDTRAMSVRKPIEIEVGSEPAHVVIDAQSKFAYVTNSMDNNLSVIDIQQKKVVTTIPTGKMPHGLRLTPDGSKLYIANMEDNSVSLIDTKGSKELSRIPVGKEPAQVGVTPDGRRVYVSLKGQNSVAVIDAAQSKKIATIAVGRNPIQVYVTPDGRYVYVANQGTEKDPDKTVSVIDTTNDTVVATIETGKGAHGVVISDDGRRAFVTNIVDNTVSVIDTATRKKIDDIKVGRGPNGITFRKANR